MKHILLLIAFLCFGWLGASKSSNEKLSEEKIDGLISSALATPEQKDLNLGALLVQLGVQYFKATSEEFFFKSQVMVERIGNYCKELSFDDSDQDSIKVSQKVAQESWQEAMGSYHKILAAPFGPMYENARQLANNIYSWPLAYECGMHLELLSVKDTGQLDPNSLFTSKGLMAVEFGLFKDLQSTKCNTRNKRFQKVHNWLELEDREKRKDMCELALAASKDVLLSGKKLSESWDISLINYTKKMVNGSVYANFQSVLNEFTDGLFTMLEIAKDVQLGKPLGLHKDCLNESGKCVEDIEHKLSQTGLSALKMQFVGFRQILDQGGLGSYLTSQGFESIYTELSIQNEDIIQYIDAISQLGSLNKLVEGSTLSECKASTDTNALVPVCTLQRKVRKLTQTIRSEFFPALQLNAPLVYQGDAD